MGLFDKKQCSICGKDIGLFGNRKLEDGNMCKDCASKLSPFFSERRHSTVVEIQQQLQYRSDNEEALRFLKPDKIVGIDKKIYLDSAQKKFVISRYDDFSKGNPDMISLAQVKDVQIECDEDKEEIFQDEEEKQSYNPPRYEYAYSFLVKLFVDSPYFSEIEIPVEDGSAPTSKQEEKYIRLKNTAKAMANLLMPDKKFDDLVDLEPVYLEAEEKKEDEWECVECKTINRGGKFCMNCGKERKLAWYCPQCGKENEGNFCIDCGTKKPDGAGVIKKEG
ncbi:MAG: DUF4428 domain-containing protein [Solobacterium sp.]|nr:DUF4428 domain-containing protein [Solobacterium sp.]